jgi:hypothetical protein
MQNIVALIGTQFQCEDHQFSYAPTPQPNGAGNHYKSTPLPPGNQSTEFINSTGVATLHAGHTIVDSSTVDVYWNGGQRLNCSAAVTVNAVTLTGGSGTALPADHTVLIVSSQVTLLDGYATSTVQALGVSCDQPATVQFQASDSSELLVLSALPYCWPTNNGEANPFTSGTVAKIVASNQNTTAATNLQITPVTST